MARLSIIIPVHNAAEYVEMTVSSILSQSFKDVEIILVDDGSTDGSGALVDALAASRTCVKVFHKPCGGVSSARNMGLDKISPESEFVMFVDSDDLLAKGSLRRLVGAMGSNPGASMALGAIGLFGEGMDDDLIPCRKAVMTSRESLCDLISCRSKKTQKYLCNRIFSTGVIKDNGLRFDEKIHYKEDGLFLVQYLLRSFGSVVYIDGLVYLYRQISTSAMGSLDNNHHNTIPADPYWNPKIMSNLDAHGRILDDLRAHRAGRRLILQEIHNTFGCRRWILRRVIGRRAGRRRASLTSLLQISRPVITALF